MSGLNGGGLRGAKREAHTVQCILPGTGQVENRGAVASLVPGAGEVRDRTGEELPRAGMLPGGNPVHGTDIEEVAGGGEGGLRSRPETHAVVGMQAFDQRLQKGGTGSRGGRTGIEAEDRAGAVDVTNGMGAGIGGKRGTSLLSLWRRSARAVVFRERRNSTRGTAWMISGVPRICAYRSHATRGKRLRRAENACHEGQRAENGFRERSYRDLGTRGRGGGGTTDWN